MLKRLLAKASPILGSRSDWLGLCLLCRQPCDDQPLLC
ncbi:ComF family protein, partial [Aeromonas rivipollensis]